MYPRKRLRCGKTKFDAHKYVEVNANEVKPGWACPFCDVL